MVGDKVICRLCGNTWVVKDFNFHDLCDSCFEKFDKQKMKDRLGIFFDPLSHDLKQVMQEFGSALPPWLK